MACCTLKLTFLRIKMEMQQNMHSVRKSPAQRSTTDFTCHDIGTWVL